MAPTRVDVREVLQRRMGGCYRADHIDATTDAVMRLLDQTQQPLARGVVDHYDTAGCLAVEVGVQDVAMGTRVVIYEDEP